MTSKNNLPIHHTTTCRTQNAQQSTWEFSCPSCGYRAQYRINLGHDLQQFEILAIGNLQARHTNTYGPAQANGLPAAPTRYEDESWLTLELKQQMEDLLKDVDLGD